ncbi:cysteine-rich PDZ-binding protein-like [Tigriopus californicus]|nr:cysteine-rich PDZ-binding protein-like [Tigriopus californicus]
MVCEKCEKKGKLSKVVTPDPWKSGAYKHAGGKTLNENKLLTAKRKRFNPTSVDFPKCKICKSRVHQFGAHYCQECAYKKAICALCGVKLMKTKNYKQSST